MTTPDQRPRIVEVAFWSWIAAAIFLVLGGLLAVTTGYDSLRGHIAASVTDDEVRSLLTLIRCTGAVYIVLGAAVGYLAGRTRGGNRRFRRAAVALSFAAVALVALAAILLGFLPPLAPFAVIALIAGGVSATREKANAWFDTVDSGGSGG